MLAVDGFKAWSTGALPSVGSVSLACDRHPLRAGLHGADVRGCIFGCVAHQEWEEVIPAALLYRLAPYAAGALALALIIGSVWAWHNG